MKLSAAYILLAQKLQESASAMCHEDIRTRLQDCLRDDFKGTGNWCYIVAVFGDDKSGDLVYSCNSDLKKAAYTLKAGKTTIDTAGAVDVQPLTTYEVEATEVLEAGRRNSSRDLKQLQSIHDASTVLGAACAARESRASGAGTPAYTGAGKSSRSAGTDSTNEAQESGNPQGDLGGANSELVGRETLNNLSLSLVESATTLEAIRLVEARADYEIKLIAPGKGSSAFYPAEVLKRDGPSVFKEGTHVYLNHATRSEESERPEGDVKNLAGVLSKGAYWVESHAKGPGLYGRMKVFADHAQIVEEKAAHVGMSIRANGEAVMESGRQVLTEGLPTLARLKSAESVDVVTRAGAGGMILTEAAVVPATTKTGDGQMDQAEIQKLIETGIKAANAPLLERALKGDAREAATKILAGITLAEACKQRVIDVVLRDLPRTEAGELDAAKFTALVTEEAKREGEYVATLTGSGQVRGMGASGDGRSAEETDPVKIAEAKARLKAEEEGAIDIFESMGMPKDAATLAAKGRAA